MDYWNVWAYFFQSTFTMIAYELVFQADFAETTPIPVRLEVSESDSVPPLPDDSTTSVLGGPLTPVLQRYTVGNQQVATAITQDVRKKKLLFADHVF